MNRFVLDALPETLSVDGRALSIDTDFRTWIRFEQMLKENVPDAWKVDVAVYMCFGKSAEIVNLAEAMNQIYLFYCIGRDERKPKTTKNTRKRDLRPKRIYDYEYDMPLIYGAFLSQYHVNLQSISQLHWWEFKAMFNSLADDQEIKKVMGYRAVDLGKIKNKAEHKRYAELQEYWRLPDGVDEKSKIEKAGSIFAF